MATCLSVCEPSPLPNNTTKHQDCYGSICLSVILPFQNLSNLDFREQLKLTNADNSVVLDDDAYFTPKQISNIMGENKLKSFLVAHFNTRSLAKNKNLREEFITEINHSPEVIGISETKINENISLNLQIPNYLFFHNDSSTNAGGTGMYIKQNLKYKLRQDLSLNVPKCEDTWVEIETNHGCIIVAVIYRHPETNFQTFEILLTNLLVELENQKLNYVVCGDININSLALNNTKTKNYLNSSNSVGCRLSIEAPTRFSTMSKPSLLYHIYSNITRKTLLTKPCLYDISDHLPVCLIIKNLNSNKKGEIKLKRSMTLFVTEDFLIDLGSTLENYPEINPNSSVNDDLSELTSIFMKTLDKHAPLKPMSRREIKLNAKPWITKGILISIKTRNRLLKSCYQCQDPVKIEHYKKYRNKLTHIKALAKQQHYDSLSRKNSNNPKKSWSVM